MKKYSGVVPKVFEIPWIGVTFKIPALDYFYFIKLKTYISTSIPNQRSNH